MLVHSGLCLVGAVAPCSPQPSRSWELGLPGWLSLRFNVLTMAFAVGHISGGHFNPAVTLGLWAGGRFPAKDVIGYIIAQVVGGIIAAAVLYVVASGKAGFDAAASGFASNGFGEHSPWRLLHAVRHY